MSRYNSTQGKGLFQDRVVSVSQRKRYRRIGEYRSVGDYVKKLALQD